MFLYFPTMSCIVVNTVCNYFGAHVYWICVNVSKLLIFSVEYQFGCLTYQLSIFQSQFTNLSTERLISFSWAENVCVHKAEHINESTVLHQSSGRLIILLKLCTGSSLYIACYDVHIVYISAFLFKIPSGLLITPSYPWNTCIFLHEKSVWNVRSCNKQDAFVKAVICFSFCLNNLIKKNT